MLKSRSWSTFPSGQNKTPLNGGQHHFLVLDLVKQVDDAHGNSVLCSQPC
jgi:hypothetical protein